jgi:hypothetical protein
MTASASRRVGVDEQGGASSAVEARQAPLPVTSERTFYEFLTAVVGRRAWSSSFQVDVRRHGALGRVYHVTIDGRGVGCFTGDEIEARHRLADVLHNAREHYGDDAA